jgi:hypothetical protein
MATDSGIAHGAAVARTGISVLFGIPLMIISAQLVLGGRRAWLPAFILRQSMTRADYVVLMAHMQPTVERFEPLVRPRALSGLPMIGRRSRSD